MRKPVFVVALALTAGAIIGTAACEPTPPPPPPTTVAMQYPTCVAPQLNLEPFRCATQSQAWMGTTWATLVAGSTEPPTRIDVDATLERKMPDGSWGYGGWVSRGTIDNRDGHYTTEQVPNCAPGIYRWRGRFICDPSEHDVDRSRQRGGHQVTATQHDPNYPVSPDPERDAGPGLVWVLGIDPDPGYEARATQYRDGNATARSVSGARSMIVGFLHNLGLVPNETEERWSWPDPEPAHPFPPTVPGPPSNPPS